MYHRKLVSVIVNCKNSEKYLKECIDSILNQTYSNFEVIIVNNQSTDNTKNIISAYSDNRIRYYETTKSLPLGAARNFAIEMSAGYFIAFLDSDDIWYKNKLELVLQKFVGNIGLVYSDVLYFNNKKSFNLYSARKRYKGYCFNQLLFDYNLCLSSCVISREIISRNKIHFDKRLQVSNDLDFFLKIAFYSELDYVEDVLVKYRIHSTNLSLKHPEKFYSEFDLTISTLKNHFKIDNDIINIAQAQNIINKSKFFWKKNRRYDAYLALFKVKRLYLKAIFFGIIIIFPFKLIDALYRPFSSIKVRFE